MFKGSEWHMLPPSFNEGTNAIGTKPFHYHNLKMKHHCSQTAKKIPSTVCWLSAQCKGVPTTSILGVR